MHLHFLSSKQNGSEPIILRMVFCIERKLCTVYGIATTILNITVLKKAKINDFVLFQPCMTFFLVNKMKIFSSGCSYNSWVQNVSHRGIQKVPLKKFEHYVQPKST